MKVIQQFGFKFKSPIGAVLDCRVLPNPFKHGVPDEVLIERVRGLEGFNELVQKGVQLLAKHDEIYVGCAFGRHRSGAVAQEIARQTGAEIRKY